MVKNHANITSHSSKGYRTVKNLGATDVNPSNLDGTLNKIVNNAGLDTRITAGRKGGKKRTGMSERMQRAISSRPTMHIKDGKLLLTGLVEKKQTYY